MRNEGYAGTVKRAPFGRTNLDVPRLWLRLGSHGTSEERQGLLDEAVASGAPLDVTAPAALWGRHLRGAANLLAVRAGLDLEHTGGGSHTAGQVEAHLFETLCSLQRETVDFYFLRIENTLSESQIGGALEALENARVEGHLRFLGLEIGRDGAAALAAWRLHDAFECVMVAGRPQEGAFALAGERRVGLVLSLPSLDRWQETLEALPGDSAGRLPTGSLLGALCQHHACLLPVRSRGEVLEAFAAVEREELPLSLQSVGPILEALDACGAAR